MQSKPYTLDPVNVKLLIVQPKPETLSRIYMKLEYSQALDVELGMGLHGGRR